MRNTLIPVFLLLPLAACQTGVGSANRIVELYDMADPAGVIEIELTRTGAIRELEAQIPISDLPANVRQAALAELEGAEITGGEREYNMATDCWEVQLRHEGKDWELVIDDNGTILEREEPIDASAGPANLVDNATAEVPPGSELKSVERITVARDGGRVEYHVKFSHNEASYKVVLDANANVDRVVREQRAEIEIPIR